MDKKRIETTCAKNQVVPTTEDQKNTVPNAKKTDNSSAFIRSLVNLNRRKYIKTISRLPRMIDTCCWVMFLKKIMKGIKAKDAPGGKGKYILLSKTILS